MRNLYECPICMKNMKKYFTFWPGKFENSQNRAKGSSGGNRRTTPTHFRADLDL